MIFIDLYDKIRDMKNKDNKIKRILAVLLLLVILAVSGCSGNESGNSEREVSTTSNVVRITFPEGSTVSQMALLLEENGVCSAADFMAQANEPLNLEGCGFEIPNPAERAFLLEGYLFPDTYEFYRGESAESAIGRFLKNSKAKLDGEIVSRCNELGLSLDEVLTIASIIQEEAGVPAEMSKVSSVIHNRLNSDDFPRLQCDAATFYLRKYVEPYVDEAGMEALSERYNTYKCKGLPAGPITNSGIDAVKAALYPEETDYYFFVTDSNGVYYYAETWDEHIKNCDIAGL